MRYLKPHGALYHRVVDDEEQARAVLAGSGHAAGARACRAALLLELAAAAGRATYREGFPDRGYGDDGRLLPRDQPGAVLDRRRRDRGAGRSSWRPTVDSVCVHGDSPGRGRPRARRPGARSRPPGSPLRGL